MNDHDFWARIEAATDRAIDMARAERVQSRAREQERQRRVLGAWATADWWKGMTP